MKKKQRTTVRQVRKNLRRFLNGSAAIAIGHDYALRAILIPVPEHDSYNKMDTAKARIKMTAQLQEILDAELPVKPTPL